MNFLNCMDECHIMNKAVSQHYNITYIILIIEQKKRYLDTISIKTNKLLNVLLINSRAQYRTMHLLYPSYKRTTKHICVHQNRPRVVSFNIKVTYNLTQNSVLVLRFFFLYFNF